MIYRLIKIFKNKRETQKFISTVHAEYQKLGIKFEFYNVGLHREDPTETPDHYQIFTWWVVKDLLDKNGLNILDVGGTKIGHFINSIKHQVYALVLKPPVLDLDLFPNLNYIQHDISDPLPFENNFFDVFVSPGTLHLVGLGRYGDKKNPLALLNFLNELKRVLKNNANIYLLLPLGKDQLLFGLHFIYSFKSIKKIFSEYLGAKICDYFVDEYVRFGFEKPYRGKQRFSRNVDTSYFKKRQYKIIYLKLRKVEE